MPKMKTHSGTKKRFSLTKNNKIKHMSANRAHCLTGKTAKRKTALKQTAFASATNTSHIKKLLPYD